MEKMKPMDVGLEQLDFIPFYLRFPVASVYEILDNAVHEAQAGFATQIDVLHSDGSVSITDNGRGVCNLNYFTARNDVIYNNHVGVEHFPSLVEELQKTDWRKTLSSFESIATRIEKDRGKVTKLSHSTVQVLVCAAVKEMEDFSVKKLDMESFKK
ncbi:hypothetical protein PVK06_042029 [Gossypium arboreum]|uniref:Uncharacterized protein n=1 Tax=Gossypium arboreum TaxID=29729 RepID=A0ABR0NAF4_GOSAR|nr:hypothetical protein PVK06_042029 [Gossypium arboreum]